MAAEAGFLGVPLDGFAATGKKQLDALVTLGLKSDSKLLDIGCGCLRGGYWLIHFLAPGRYFGIEPHRKRVELGLRYLIEPDVLVEKRPRFDANDAFDTSVFRERFDFFLASSIWSHASKPQIERMLDGFLRDTREEGVFMTSYVPPAGPEDDYRGREWVGTSHTCDVPGVISHSVKWIGQACPRRRLGVLADGLAEGDHEVGRARHAGDPSAGRTAGSMEKRSVLDRGGAPGLSTVRARLPRRAARRGQGPEHVPDHDTRPPHGQAARE